MIQRDLQEHIVRRMKPGHASLIFGARRVGKTVLLKNIINGFSGNKLMLNGEDYDVHQILENKSSANYKHFFGHLQLLAIDEAQNIPDIGGKLKFLVDELPELIVMASGSSSFDLKNKAGEPLVGRSTSYLLCPFTRKKLHKQCRHLT